LDAPVLYEVAEHVATITLNRPERRNAMNILGYRELCDAIERASEDPEVRCLLITGTDPAFCAGDDIGILSGEDDPTDPSGEPLKLKLPGGSLRRCSKPVIAAVNGPAVGYGIEILVLSDFRLAAEEASFAAMYVRRSLVAPADSWERLPAIVGLEAAAELLLAGDAIGAERALAIGLVSRVLPHDELLPAARALAARLCSTPPLALQASKQALVLARKGDRKALCDHINASTAALSQTEDYRESIRAFRERREPVFKGR
jgi:enoyl-CoA hydratase/carnithine racemase